MPACTTSPPRRRIGARRRGCWKPRAPGPSRRKRRASPCRGLDDPAKLLIGVEHYAAHCAVCHGAPGVSRGDIARGLYPPPPDLAKTAPLYTPAELFWIVKHGIKMTGMPAWSNHSDDELWATVGF